MNNDAPTPRNTTAEEKPKSPRRELTPEFDRHAKTAWVDKLNKKGNKTKINQAREWKYQNG